MSYHGMAFYRISPADNPDWCLDVQEIEGGDSGGKMITFLTKCREISSLEEDPQIMLINTEPSISDGIKYSVHSISAVDDEGFLSILFAANVVRLSIPTITQWVLVQGPCALPKSSSTLLCPVPLLHTARNSEKRRKRSLLSSRAES